ncbi:unnamed protein product, partial [Chrysoparadoxa australica]
LHVGSQWFVIPPSYAAWLLNDTALVPHFTQYAQHIVVADEVFFSTLLKHSPHCHDHVNENFLYASFSSNKEHCLMPSPTHCGRSPKASPGDQ